MSLPSRWIINSFSFYFKFRNPETSSFPHYLQHLTSFQPFFSIYHISIFSQSNFIDPVPLWGENRHSQNGVVRGWAGRREQRLGGWRKLELCSYTSHEIAQFPLIVSPWVFPQRRHSGPEFSRLVVRCSRERKPRKQQALFLWAPTCWGQ